MKRIFPKARMRNLIAALLLFCFTLPLSAATGDILSCEVLGAYPNAGDPSGWAAKCIIDNFVDGGTYDWSSTAGTQSELDDLTKCAVAFTVTSDGYDATGSLGTKVRTVCGTRVVQKAYPNQANRDETEAAGDLEIVFALSDNIYAEDDAAGSGTDPTVTIMAGWYTDNGAGGGSTGNNVATALTVTNSSALDYPDVIARWVTVPNQIFGPTNANIGVAASLDIEMVAFHGFAEAGKQVAAVKFTCSDQAAGGVNTVTATVTEMTKSSLADSLPVYKTTINASSFDSAEQVDCNFIAYPWVGDADDIVDTSGGTTSPTLLLGPLEFLADKNDAYGITVAYVDTSTGADPCTAADIDSDSAASADPCATLDGAADAIAAYNNTNHSRNTADAGVIYLNNNNHAWAGVTTTTTASNWWLTVTHAPGVAEADAKFASGSALDDFGPTMQRYLDITFDRTTETSFWLNLTSDYGWFDSCSFVANLADGNNIFIGAAAVYATFNTVDSVDDGLGHFSTVNRGALHRGNTFTNAKITVGFSRVIVSNVVDQNSASTAAFVQDESTGLIIYANKVYLGYKADILLDFATTGSESMAVVGNLLERVGAGGTALQEAYAAGTTATDNVLVMHNTVAGERSLICYVSTATNVVRSNFFVKYNSFEWEATKHDVFATTATSTGGWPCLYGTGWIGNNSEESPDSFAPNFGGVNSTRATAAGYTDDQSITSGNAGNGDYTPTVSSVLLNNIPSGMAILPFDIDGTAIPDDGTGAAGALQRPVAATGLTVKHPKHPTHPTHGKRGGLLALLDGVADWYVGVYNRDPGQFLAALLMAPVMLLLALMIWWDDRRKNPTHGRIP